MPEQASNVVAQFPTLLASFNSVLLHCTCQLVDVLVLSLLQQSRETRRASATRPTHAQSLASLRHIRGHGTNWMRGEAACCAKLCLAALRSHDRFPSLMSRASIVGASGVAIGAQHAPRRPRRRSKPKLFAPCESQRVLSA